MFFVRTVKPFAIDFPNLCNEGYPIMIFNLDLFYA